MTEREKYEAEIMADVVQMFPRPGMPLYRRPRMDQQDLDNEEDAARIVFTGAERFLADLERAATLSELKHDQIIELRDIVRDYMPGKSSWYEAIDEAKRDE